MTLILFRSLPFPAIKEPVYASCSVACSNIANLIPAVHCVREWKELKWSRYRFLPAVDMLSTFCRAWTSCDLVASVSIYPKNYLLEAKGIIIWSVPFLLKHLPDWWTLAQPPRLDQPRLVLLHPTTITRCRLVEQSTRPMIGRHVPVPLQDNLAASLQRYVDWPNIRESRSLSFRKYPSW